MSQRSVISHLQSLLSTPKRILITMHQRPDGDAMGSALALANVCKALKHEVTVISPTHYPNFLHWMPGTKSMVVAENQSPAWLENVLKKHELLFCMDFAEYHRLGPIASAVAASNISKIIIDHHPNTSNFGMINICNPKEAATAAILYRLLLEMGFEHLINHKVATCLYVGIVTDTGYFCHTNTTSNVHKIASNLLKRGVQPNVIYTHLEGHKRLEKVRFLGHAILHRLVAHPEYQFAYCAIPKEDFLEFKLQPGDTKELVQYPLNITGISVSVLMTEQKNNTTHLSFRSSGDRRVNQLAAMYFQGGGHAKAAGGLSKLPLKATIEKLETILRTDKTICMLKAT